jgi:DNA replication regulator DPB11
VSVRRVPADTLQVWASVLRPRGFVVAGGRLQRSPSKSASQGGPATSPCPLPTRARTLQDLGTKPSALAGLSRAGSFAPAAKDASTPRAPNLFARAASRAAPSEDGSFFAGIRAREAAEAEAAAAPENAEAGPSRVRAVFAGLRLQACGEAACESVVRAIEGAGGMVLPEDSDEEPDFIVVRLLR